MIPSAAPLNPRATTRRSSDSVWPLRGPDGLTFAERAARNSSSTKGAGQPNKLPGDE